MTEEGKARGRVDKMIVRSRRKIIEKRGKRSGPSSEHREDSVQRMWRETKSTEYTVHGTVVT